MANILNYVKTLWKAGREGGTAWTPERLNNIEDGIEQATNQINENSKDIETNTANIVSNINSIQKDIENLKTNKANTEDIQRQYLPLTGGTITDDLRVQGNMITALWKGLGGRGLIDVITVTISGTIKASSTGQLSGTFKIPNKYSSVGIISYNLTTYSLFPVTMQVSGDTVTVAVRNVTSSSVSVTNATAAVLLLRNAV